jgi:hypothetical protein
VIPAENTVKLCVDSGGQVDLVPGFVNPVLYVAIALALAGVAGAIATWRRKGQVMPPRARQTM